MADASPYRGGPRASAPPEAPRDDGLVHELIQQFADPLAFYRELVQNSIDAGASAIAITLGYDDADGRLRVTVRDDGCGMTRATLEDELTVLFRSGKEHDATKIGKFGVGFVSVLAVAPELVTIRTCRADGEPLELQLHPDQSYDLFRADQPASAGTSVSLLVPLVADRFETFVEGSEKALRTWCRHAEIPVRFVATRAGAPEPSRELRIDRPFALDALVEVRLEEDGRTIVAGLPTDGQPYLGFFKRGLLLHETSREAMGAVAIKIQDPALEHTLSRDNVRRTAAYERAMRAARHAVDRLLARKVEEALAHVARDRSRAPALDTLIVAAQKAELLPADFALPLTHPREGRTTIALSALDDDAVCIAPEASPRAALAAQAGAAVIDASVAERPELYRQWLAQHAQRAIPTLEEAWIAVDAVPLAPSDLVLIERTAALLDALARKPPELRIVAFDRLPEGSFCAPGVGRPLPTAIRVGEIRRHPFALLRRPPLWLDAQAPIVGAARYAAEDDPRFAASILARAIVRAYGALEEDAWLARALEEIA